MRNGKKDTDRKAGNKANNEKSTQKFFWTENNIKASIQKILEGSSKEKKECLTKSQNDKDPSTAGNRSYEQSYAVIRRWCGMQRHHWTADSCILLAHIVYGWMPTILTLSPGQPAGDENSDAIFQDAETIAELLNTDACITAQEPAKESYLELLKAFVNNSFIGASKILHFIYPHHYAIWDSNVADAIKNADHLQDKQYTSAPSNEQNNDLKHFLAYQKAICQCLDSAKKTTPQKTLRDIEQILFETGQEIEHDNKTNDTPVVTDQNKTKITEIPVNNSGENNPQ